MQFGAGRGVSGLRVLSGIRGNVFAAALGPPARARSPRGVVAAGAQADLAVLDGDPLADTEIIGDPARMGLIMTAGAILNARLGAEFLEARS